MNNCYVHFVLSLHVYEFMSYLFSYQLVIATYVGIVMGYCYIHCTLIYCIALSSDCTVVEVAVNSHCTAQWSPWSHLVFLVFSVLKGSLHYITFFWNVFYTSQNSMILMWMFLYQESSCKHIVKLCSKTKFINQILLAGLYQ